MNIEFDITNIIQLHCSLNDVSIRGLQLLNYSYFQRKYLDYEYDLTLSVTQGLADSPNFSSSKNPRSFS